MIDLEIIMIEKLLTPTEVADILQRPKTTLAQWRYLGRGPRFVKVEGRVMYRPRDLNRYLDAESHGEAA